MLGYPLQWWNNTNWKSTIKTLVQPPRLLLQVSFVYLEQAFAFYEKAYPEPYHTSRMERFAIRIAIRKELKQIILEGIFFYGNMRVASKY